VPTTGSTVELLNCLILFKLPIGGRGQPKNEWAEKAVAERSPNAYLLNITIFYDKQYFESAPHQRILRKMGLAK
jgi:hypothetical protein